MNVDLPSKPIEEAGMVKAPSRGVARRLKEGFCELPAKDVSRVLRALAAIAHVTLEDRDAVLPAIDADDKGLDFADAKRAEGLAWAPPVALLA